VAATTLNTPNSKLQTPKKSAMMSILILICTFSHAQLIIPANLVGGFPVSGSINDINFSSYSPADKALAKSGIEINYGNYLNIDEDIDFNPGASIIVNHGWAGIYVNSLVGAGLAIQNRLWCSSGTWAGIKVYGASYMPHFFINPNESVYNDIGAYMGSIDRYHGFVDLQSGAIIENADHGVWSLDGGIVQSFVGPFAGKPQFVNCQEGLYVENSIQSPSAIRLNRCDFSWTDPNIHGYSDYYGFAHITISQSKDIRIGGCTIAGEYTMGRKYDTDVKGTGVLVIGQETTYSLSEGGNTFASGAGTDCISIKYDSDPTGTHQNIIAHFTTGVDVISSKDGAINNCIFIANITAARVVGDFVDFHDNIFRAKDDWMIQHFNPSPFVSSKLCIDLASIKAASIYRNTFNYHNFSFPNSPWPALAMVSINGYTGGAIKVIDNTFNGDVDQTKLTQYAISAGGDLQNFEWTCNTFNDFETAVIYSGNGPVQNPASGNLAENTYTNISQEYVKNLSSVTPMVYKGTFFLNIGVFFDASAEPGNCSIDCNSMATKYKKSPTTASIEDIETETINLYPNPASSEINLEVKDGVGARLEIYSVMGELVYAETLESAHTQIDCSSFSAGLYTVTVVSDKGVISKKIIINR
jgi:hypothetical protein